jgi:hypothetical protein
MAYPHCVENSKLNATAKYIRFDIKPPEVFFITI